MKNAKINIKEHKIEIFWEEKQKAVAPAEKRPRVLKPILTIGSQSKEENMFRLIF